MSSNSKTAINWKFWQDQPAVPDKVKQHFDQSAVPEQYQTPDQYIPQKELPYLTEDDPSQDLRWSYHPEKGLYVWPANAGFHMDWHTLMVYQDLRMMTSMLVAS
jgi:hypothetical protein